MKRANCIERANRLPHTFLRGRRWEGFSYCALDTRPDALHVRIQSSQQHSQLGIVSLSFTNEEENYPQGLR